MRVRWQFWTLLMVFVCALSLVVHPLNSDNQQLAAFINVTIVPMDRDGVLANQTVIE